MKNKLIDLNNHLFAQLERLNEENISNEKLSTEIERSKAIAGIAREIIGNGNLALKAEEMRQNERIPKLPDFLLLGKQE